MTDYSAYKDPERRKLYIRWHTMKARCTNPNAQAYDRYGGRGIEICDRWKIFQNFYDDMGLPPFPRATIDRIDNDGPYSPDNCEWATYAEQANNSSQTRHVVVDGETMPLKRAAKKMGIAAGSLRGRLNALNAWGK